MRNRLAGLKSAVKQVHLKRILLESNVRAMVRGRRLPPGHLQVLSSKAMADQQFLLKESERLGPIFKVWWGGKFTTCIVGHELGRRFLNETEGKTKAATTDLTDLFPFGFLRAMEGDPHRKYRRIFIDAFKRTPLTEHEDSIRNAIRKNLDDLAKNSGPASADVIRKAFKKATTQIQFELILGIQPDSPAYVPLAAAYDIYAPDGMFIVAKDKHKAAYEQLRAMVLGVIEQNRGKRAAVNCLLAQLVDSSDFDDTVMGNLIQMTEASRYDLHGLWFWIMNMLSQDGAILQVVRNAGSDAERREVSRAVAQEALRMEQSEFIHRAATADIDFNGFYMPKDTRIRICVWEGHRDASKFADPFIFDPARFIREKPSINSYAPFGMDKHRCLGGDWTIELSAIFVEELAKGFEWDVVSNGPSVRGTFHFEPSDDFAAKIRVLTDA